MTQAAKNAWQVTKIVFLRLRFILLFVVIGVISWKWELIMNVIEKRLRPAKAEVSVQGEFEYFCPMHPSIVRADDKEKCPICGMPLSKRKKGEQIQLGEGIVGRLQLTPFRIRQAGVATEEIGYRTLVREIRTVGLIEWDERRFAHLSARVAGRADELFINFTGVRVKKGDPVYRLYSPDLVTTQEEYLLALRTLDEMKGTADAPALDRAKRLVESSRERLKLWGVTDAQLKELEEKKKVATHLTIASPAGGIVIKKDIHAGHYVQVGEDPYTIVDDSVIWMQAEIFERDLGLVKEGQVVDLTTEAYPGETFSGKVIFVAPQLQAETRTVKVRVDVDNPQGKLKEGMYVNALLRIPLGKQGEVFYGCWEQCPDVRSDVAIKCPKCSMVLVKKGGVKAEEPPAPKIPELKPDLPPGKDFVYKCPMDGAVIDKPGLCPKCKMPLDERHKVPKASPSEARTIYFCDVHPEQVFDKPGRCLKDSCKEADNGLGMELYERKLAPGSRLIYACPEHPEITSDKPGTCTKEKCGKKLAFKIVSEGTQLTDRWICPLHPEKTADGKLKCPECGREMKHLEFEQMLAVPFSAVIDTGIRKVAFVDKGHGTFDAVTIEIGPRAGEYYPVLKGLVAGDRVVTSGAFLLDAETRLNPAAGVIYFGASGAEPKK